MKVLKNLLSIVPYPLFPTTSAGRKTILHFNNYLSKKINAHADGIIDSRFFLVDAQTFGLVAGNDAVIDKNIAPIHRYRGERFV